MKNTCYTISISSTVAESMAYLNFHKSGFILIDGHSQLYTKQIMHTVLRKKVLDKANKKKRGTVGMVGTYAMQIHTPAITKCT